MSKVLDQKNVFVNVTIKQGFAAMSSDYGNDPDVWRCAIAAQRLEEDPSLYRPGLGMFACACKCWGVVNVVTYDIPTGKFIEWNVDRSHKCVYIPKFSATDSLFLKKVTGSMEEDIPLEFLQDIVSRLDDDDMAAFFRHVRFSNNEAFETMFTPEFVGTDERLMYIRDFVASHMKDNSFDGRTQADKTKVFRSA